MPGPFPSRASDRRFGELRERTLHRQLKALYRPTDGEVEWRVAGSIADVWSPTAGVIEIQTATLAKLRPRVATYLGAGLDVTVVFPLAIHRTLVTWDAERTEVLARRKSPKADRIEAAFVEIGALADVLLHPRFRLTVALVRETEVRCADGKGSWRRRGTSKIDRVLDELTGERVFRTRADYAALVPGAWAQPGTAASLAAALSLTPRHVQAFISCMKKIGVLEVCGQTGRAHLLRRTATGAARET